MLDVKSIDLHYGAAQALRSVSLQAKIGEVTCVLGRSPSVTLGIRREPTSTSAMWC